MRIVKRNSRASIAFIVAIAGTAAPRPVAAVDGVIEINQARALAGGVTPGDQAGFPVEIKVSGSYRLTSDLTVAGQDAIDVVSPALDVTIDLNGFAVSGSASAPYGISGEAGVRLHLRNGSVRGFSTSGIFALGPATVEAIHAETNFHGIFVADNSRVIDSTVLSNPGTGIATGVGSVVRGCVANGNSIGIGVDFRSMVTASEASSNSIAGIFAYDGSSLIGNSINDNHTGIFASAGSSVIDNTIRGSTVFAIEFLGDYVAYGRNAMTNNNNGNANAQVGGSGLATSIQIAPNVCGSDMACP